jgi:DnaJ like chaperone protein
MRYRNYNNKSNIGWLIFLLFMFMGGFKFIFVLVPLLMAIVVYFFPFIVFALIFSGIIKKVLFNNKIRSRLNNSTADHSRFVDILIHILVHAVNADGHVDTREVQTIKDFFRVSMHYKQVEMMWVDDLINNALKNTYPLDDICREFEKSFNYEARLILLELVFKVICADGFIADSERRFVAKLLSLLHITEIDYSRIASVYDKDLASDEHYAVLGLKRGASKEEIKKAYKDASKKYHPDKVYHLGEEFREVAEEKMRAINKAYQALR